jgi:protein phosphatase methylesterase 1
MGGSIATKTVAHLLINESQYKNISPKIQGLVVIDVVEGTAMEALPFMEEIVNSRPKSFKTVENAISYMINSGTIKNNESARISVPPLVNETTTKKKEKEYVWKNDLLLSKPYWKGN